MPVVEVQESETVPLAKGDDSSFETEKFSSQEHANPLVASRGSSFEVSRVFAGPGLRCLNLALRTSNLDDVVDYLLASPEASRIVVETFHAVREHFSSPIRLELYPDPEGERKDELALIVETTDEPKDAIQKLDSFDDAFWLDRVNDFGEHLSVHVEYQ